jgi:hypothetical protein
MNRTTDTTARSALGVAWPSLFGAVGGMGKRSAANAPAPI